MNDEDEVLIAISLQEINNKWPSPTALFRGYSETPEASFVYETGHLLPEMIEKCRRFEKHGVSVVKAESGWQSDKTWEAAKWRVSLIEQAMRRMELSATTAVEGDPKSPKHDPDFADLVLKKIFANYPHSVSVLWLKYHLNPEPSDIKLLTALRALTLEKLIESNQDLVGSNNKLKHIRNIHLTHTGVSQCRGQIPSAMQQVTNNVYGQNSRITFGTDNSSNSVINKGELFNKIANEIEKYSGTEKDEVMSYLDGVRTAKTQSSALEKYQKLVVCASSTLNLATNVMPHLSQLFAWIINLPK